QRALAEGGAAQREGGREGGLAHASAADADQGVLLRHRLAERVHPLSVSTASASAIFSIAARPKRSTKRRGTVVTGSPSAFFSRSRDSAEAFARAKWFRATAASSGPSWARLASSKRGGAKALSTMT